MANGKVGTALCLLTRALLAPLTFNIFSKLIFLLLLLLSSYGKLLYTSIRVCLKAIRS